MNTTSEELCRVLIVEKTGLTHLISGATMVACWKKVCVFINRNACKVQALLPYRLEK